MISAKRLDVLYSINKENFLLLARKKQRSTQLQRADASSSAEANEAFEDQLDNLGNGPNIRSVVAR